MSNRDTIRDRMRSLTTPAKLTRAMRTASSLRLLDAVATAVDTVKVDGSDVAVTLPALSPVISGDFAQVLEEGPNRLILGPLNPSGDYAPGLPAFPAGSVNYARIHRSGGLVRVSISFSVTGVGAASAAMVNVPFTFAHNDDYEQVGSGHWYDASVPRNRPLSVARDGVNQRVLMIADDGKDVLLGSDLANGDRVRICFDYQWA